MKREKLCLLSRNPTSPSNPRLRGGSFLLHHGGLSLHHEGSLLLRNGGSLLSHGGSVPRLRLLHRHALNHTVTYPSLTTKTPSLFPPPLPSMTVGNNNHHHSPDRRQLGKFSGVQLLHSWRTVTDATPFFTVVPSPDPRPPPEPPPPPQPPLFIFTEALPDLARDRPAPKPPWILCNLPLLAIWLSFKLYVFMFAEEVPLTCALLCFIWCALLLFCIVLLGLAVACFMVALRVFVSLAVRIFGIGFLYPYTIETTANHIFLSACQMNSTHVMILAIIETSYRRNVLAKVKEMIRNWMGLKTEGPLATVHVWMKLDLLLGFWYRFVYHELLTVKKRKVRARIIINLPFYCDGQTTTMLVLGVDQFEICFSRFVLALVQNMIRNWIDSKTMISPLLASNHVWKKRALLLGLDVWFDVILLRLKLLCNDPINLVAQTTRNTSKVLIGNALAAVYLNCNLFNFF